MNEYKKRVYQGIICVTALTLISMPAFSAEKTDKVAPLHSFFAKTEKPKTESNVTNETTKTKKASKKEKEIKTNVKDPAIKGINAIKGSVFTMENCVEYALENDPNIKNYRNTQEAQKSEVGIAKSSYFPSITGGTGYNINNTKYFGDKSNSLNNNYYGLDLSITEMIWDFGKTSAKINMSKFNYEAAGYDVENSILYRIYDVKIAYTAVLAARANVDIYARSVRINKLNVDRTKAMYEVGLKSKIDVVNADANLTEAKISLLEAQKEYEVSLIELNNSMFYVNAPSYLIQNTETFNFQKNYSVKNELNVAYDRKHYDASSVEAEMKDGAILTSGIEKQDILKTYKFKPFPYTMDEAIQLAYQNRPDLKSLILVRRASEESLKAIKRSYFPAINASGGYSLMKQSDYGTHQVGVYAGLDFPNVNIMSIKNQIKEGQAYLNIADNNVDLIKKNIYFSIQSYYVNMKDLEKRIPLMSKKVEETFENFELADGRYAVGLGNYLELQQAQTDYNNAQLAFVKSVFDYNEARFYLEESMGLK